MQDSHSSSANYPPNSESSETYDSWEQVGGYFDGDGNVGLEVVKYVLKFKLRFADTWRPQIAAVQGFMQANAISTSAIWHEKREGRSDAYRVEVSAVSSVLAAAKAMLPHCVKKAEDLRIMIDYLEGRISGNEAIERYNNEVSKGRRSGYVREPTLPFLRVEGLRKAELENAKKARAAYAVNVSPEVQERIRRDHSVLRLSHVTLGNKYGYSVSVIRRILGTR